VERRGGERGEEGEQRLGAARAGQAGVHGSGRLGRKSGKFSDGGAECGGVFWRAAMLRASFRRRSALD
jgi:hypothetical protein